MSYKLDPEETAAYWATRAEPLSTRAILDAIKAEIRVEIADVERMKDEAFDRGDETVGRSSEVYEVALEQALAIIERHENKAQP